MHFSVRKLSRESLHRQIFDRLCTIKKQNASIYTFHFALIAYYKQRIVKKHLNIKDL